jgi:hypothetical protein
MGGGGYVDEERSGPDRKTPSTYEDILRADKDREAWVREQQLLDERTRSARQG